MTDEQKIQEITLAASKHLKEFRTLLQEHNNLLEARHQAEDRARVTFNAFYKNCPYRKSDKFLDTFDGVKGFCSHPDQELCDCAFSPDEEDINFIRHNNCPFLTLKDI